MPMRNISVDPMTFILKLSIPHQGYRSTSSKIMRFMASAWPVKHCIMRDSTMRFSLIWIENTCREKTKSCTSNTLELQEKHHLPHGMEALFGKNKKRDIGWVWPANTLEQAHGGLLKIIWATNPTPCECMCRYRKLIRLSQMGIWFLKRMWTMAMKALNGWFNIP